LAQANVGLAMGTGTDIDMNGARIVLVRGELTGIARARILSQRTMRNIRQILFFAFVYNFVGVPVAAGVLYPTFGIVLSPMIASAAMALSAVSIIANALRLRAPSIGRMDTKGWPVMRQVRIEYTPTGAIFLPGAAQSIVDVNSHTVTATLGPAQTSPQVFAIVLTSADFPAQGFAHGR